MAAFILPQYRSPLKAVLLRTHISVLQRHQYHKLDRPRDYTAYLKASIVEIFLQFLISLYHSWICNVFIILPEEGEHY